MNANYQSVIHKIFPNAQIIVNRFHIVQLYSRAWIKLESVVLKK
ncbi:transposase [Companilactobacillus paralimentarius]